MSDPQTVRRETATAPSRRELANAIRALAMDAVQAANSGHPGAPMGMADIAEVLWRDLLRHNPANPHWANRDRFVLSNGHGSMLLYALLHLSGYDLPLEEIKNFRQLGSKTPGHPEYHDTPGVETTTGPLGQGLTNAVGMALAEAHLAARFNKPGLNLVDHHTYVFAGDGCLMEGISHEACSLAGTLGLGKLIVVYDDNGISIDGEVEGWFGDDTPARFEAYGWQVIPAVDGHDADAVRVALETARANTTQPTLICCETTIGWGSPNKAGTESCHGAALGADEVAATRENLGWRYPPFEIPDALYAAWDARAAGAAAERSWTEVLAAYRDKYPAEAAEFERVMAGRLPADWADSARAIVADIAAAGGKDATRKSSERVLDRLGAALPELVGGSADLTGSNLTWHKASRGITAADKSGNYVWYGVREFAMSAMMNGMALHGGVIPYGGTFLVFSDYARNAVRMAALMGQGSLFVYTHDSIGLGEDGPTHQPIEHAASLRLIPKLDVWRPADAAETAAAWVAAIERRDGPSCFLLSRQGLPAQARDDAQLAAMARGGYVLLEPARVAEAVIIATGSEVELARQAALAMNDAGAALRVVSMPCVEVFERQDAAWREAVLPRALTRRIAIEAGSTQGWYRYVGLDGLVIGLDDFGASAPAGDLSKHFGLDQASVTEKVRTYLAGA
ncbi:MAG: transketolase [Gammaproteobacteria bacterium]|nr:transketolase [Gammaproteobacteria bacterium]